MNDFETFIVWLAIVFLWVEFFYIAHLEEKIKKLKETKRKYRKIRRKKC